MVSPAMMPGKSAHKPAGNPNGSARHKTNAKSGNSPIQSKAPPTREPLGMDAEKSVKAGSSDSTMIAPASTLRWEAHAKTTTRTKIALNVACRKTISGANDTKAPF